MLVFIDIDRLIAKLLRKCKKKYKFDANLQWSIQMSKTKSIQKTISSNFTY